VKAEYLWLFSDNQLWVRTNSDVVNVVLPIFAANSPTKSKSIANSKYKSDSCIEQKTIFGSGFANTSDSRKLKPIRIFCPEETFMEATFHSLENLFLQLGLDNDPASIDAFIRENKLEPGEALEDAPFWTPSQAAFIQECLGDDSDWAEVADQLNVLLHE